MGEKEKHLILIVIKDQFYQFLNTSMYVTNNYFKIYKAKPTRRKENA